MTTYFSAKELLEPPTERAAFSDRQAYVCAELSKLAYFKFEGGNTLDELLTFTKEVLDDESRYALLEQKLRSVLTGSPSAADAERAFEAILAEGGFTLQKTFSTRGTQAFICTKKMLLKVGDEKTVAFLSFRGTEPKDFRDIRTDIKASLIAEEVGDEEVALHSGYLEALRLIDDEINATLDNLSADQLFVTGHSLGGALAIVFTRLHAASTNGACYTYGAPPVGAVEVQYKLKTPVYEIVNEFDIVPNLPHPMVGKVLGWLLKGLRVVLKAFTVTARVLASSSLDEKLESYFDMLTRYRHPGYMSYLIGSGSAARLRYNLGLYDRVRMWLAIRGRGLSRFKKLVTDHTIDLYVDKLKEHARKRN